MRAERRISRPAPLLMGFYFGRKKMENLDRTGIVMDYPRLERMMKDYRAGKISREQFKAEFGKMQRRSGIDYRVRGLADKDGVFVVYRIEERNHRR